MKWIIALVALFGLSQVARAQPDRSSQDSKLMYSAIQKADLATIKTLLQQGYIDPNLDKSTDASIEGNATWIERIIKSPITEPQQEAILDLFLKAGADITIPSGGDEIAFLSPAVSAITTRRGDAGIHLLTFLLEHGANPNSGSERFPPIVFFLIKSIPLAYALGPGQVDYLISIYKLTVSHGADPNRDWGSQSALRVLAVRMAHDIFVSTTQNAADFDNYMKLLSQIISHDDKAYLEKDINRLDDCNFNLMAYLYAFPHAGICISAHNSSNPALATAEQKRLRDALSAVGGKDTGPKPGCLGCASLNAVEANAYIAVR
jgi:hypothetical protein